MEVCADACGCLQRPEEDIRFSRDAVTDAAAPWGAENGTQVSVRVLSALNHLATFSAPLH